MTPTAYKTTRDRLRGLLLEDLLDGDIETDAIAYRYCDMRVALVMEACEQLGLTDYDLIQTEMDFMDVERGLDVLGMT